MNDNHSSSVILYKYRDWSNSLHKTILTENELFMASPGSFNDPFDCRIPENYFLLNTDEKINQFMENIESEHKEKLSKLDNASKKQISDNFKKRFNDLDTVQEDHENHFFKQTSNCYGVFSLSTKWDSLLMWSHYANNHKGFCIGFNEDKLRESEIFGSGLRVDYNDEFPVRNPLEEIQPLNNAILQLGTKAKEWSYEEEFRLINLNPDGISASDRIVKYPDNFISEIILGIDIPEKDKVEILEISRLKKMKVFQLSKEPFKFKLKRKEI
jgi:hypothetical protein